MIKSVYLSGLQLDNLYRLDIYKFVEENPDKIRTFKNLNELETINKNLIGSGMFIKIN